MEGIIDHGTSDFIKKSSFYSFGEMIRYILICIDEIKALKL